MEHRAKLNIQIYEQNKYFNDHLQQDFIIATSVNNIHLTLTIIISNFIHRSLTGGNK